MRNPPKSKKTTTRGRKPTTPRKRLVVASRPSRSKLKTTILKNDAELGGDATRLGSVLPECAVELSKSKEYNLPQDSVTGPNTSESHINTLRHFRTLTFCAAMALLGAFFIFAFNRANGFPISLFGVGLATLIELLSVTRLLKSRRNLQRNKGAKQIGCTDITPNEVPKSEGQIRQDELAFLYSNRGGERIPRLSREARRQRIEKLLEKSRQILSRTSRLEKDELHSEAVLSFDRATRTTLSAVLLATGVETQDKEGIEGWLPHLKRILQNMRLEDIAYLKALRDRINKGYDATEAESQKAREIAQPLIDDALEFMKSFDAKGDSQRHFSSLASLTREAYADPSTHKSQHSTHSTAGTCPANTKDYLEANPKEIESKRQAPPTVIPEATDAPQAITTISKISDELDNIAKSLNFAPTDADDLEESETDSYELPSDANSPIDKVLPFEHLGDFKIVISRCALPIVASFLSDDDPSKEVKDAMDNLVTRYHTKAAFISVPSKSQDIVRECKIKSYPTTLVFHKGKKAAELTSTNLEQLAKDLSRILGSDASTENEESKDKNALSTRTENAVSLGNSHGDGMGKLEVSGQP